ncbi:hypothetical protein [Altericroceibacterium endophyticum]|uniref:Uncharacterized protein n=1 Tax=Altericroceibacterium endophyticum TaxID=1808508 RepID=A0A6I4T6Z5_9SPHN|nr:hypothetical protein [Altericroceibacterium endophyticum]MXO66716.1 hypothetical protein [Altericroceibacterium endophyticum]
MNLQIITELKLALTSYRDAVANTFQSEDMADYQRLISITEQLIEKLESGDMQEVRSLTLAFSRCVTDSFATQPHEYQRLSKLVDQVR